MRRQSKFTEEEKLAAVRMVTEGGRTVLSMDINVQTERLRRRVKEPENEVEFLKKAAAYFAKNPQ